jgi:phosphopentomutase
MRDVLKRMDAVKSGVIAATIQETDLAGHAQDPERYADRIEVVEKYLPELLEKMGSEDLLIMSADHGNDPTIGHNQHTREKTYLLAYHKEMKPEALGERTTLSDIAATAADYLGLQNIENGTSFLPFIQQERKE